MDSVYCGLGEGKMVLLAKWAEEGGSLVLLLPMLLLLLLVLVIACGLHSVAAPTSCWCCLCR
jgi:hypothetical protein